MTPTLPALRTPWVATGLAVLWGAGLIVAALTLPAYSSDPGGSATLVEVNGPGVLAIVSVPLVAALVVAGCLAAGGRGARAAAWVATGLVAGLAVLGLLSIGLGFVPVVLALAVALLASRPGGMPRGWGPPGQQ